LVWTVYNGYDGKTDGYYIYVLLFFLLSIEGSLKRGVQGERVYRMDPFVSGLAFRKLNLAL